MARPIHWFEKLHRCPESDPHGGKFDGGRHSDCAAFSRCPAADVPETRPAGPDSRRSTRVDGPTPAPSVHWATTPACGTSASRSSIGDGLLGPSHRPSRAACFVPTYAYLLTAPGHSRSSSSPMGSTAIRVHSGRCSTRGPGAGTSLPRLGSRPPRRTRRVRRPAKRVLSRRVI